MGASDRFGDDVRAEPFGHDVNGGFVVNGRCGFRRPGVDQQFIFHLKGGDGAQGFGGELQNMGSFKDVGHRWGRQDDSGEP